MNRNSSPSTPLTPPDNLTSASEVTNNSSPLQENGELFRFEEDAVSTAYTFTSAAEAIDIETQKKSAGRLEDDSKENPRSPITDFDAKLIEYTDNANKSAQKISKVVDENGEPLVVYHGTKAEFTVFDASHNHKANKGFL